MIKEGFSAWFKETFHKEDCLNNAVFTRQSLMDAWDNGYNKGKEELKEKLTKAVDIIRRLMHELVVSNIPYDDVELLVKDTEQFLKEVEA